MAQDSSVVNRIRRFFGFGAPASERGLTSNNDGHAGAPPQLDGKNTKPINAPSIAVRISAGIAVITLAVALLLGVVALRVTAELALPAAAAIELRNHLLLWGFGSVVISSLIGIVIARQIAAPILKLAEELKKNEFRSYPWPSGTKHEYAELELLSNTMADLASTIRHREQDLSESERKFREAFDLVGIGLTQVDRQGRFVVVNRRFCEMLGYSNEELIGRSFVDITHPDEQASETALIEQVVNHNDSIPNREKRYIRKDGTVLWAQRSGVVVRDSLGQPTYALGSIEDVSQYHASQETLKALNESLRAIVETSPLAIYSLTPSGIVTLWNPAAEKMFGFKQLDVLGKTSPLVAEKNSEEIIRQHARVYKGSTVNNFEVTRHRADGSPIEISFSAAPLIDAQDEIVGILATCADITSLKNTTRALDEQLHFMRELLEVLPNPIFYRSAEGPYLGFNRAHEEFFGMKRADMIGKTLHDTHSAYDADRYEQEDAEMMKTGKQHLSEATLFDSRGQRRNVLKQMSRFTNPDGRPAGVIGVITDITDFRLVEQALRATEGRFQALTESAMDIVTVLDADGKIRYQSPSVRHLLGYEPADMIGLSQFDIIHRDDVDLLREKFKELIDKGVMERPVEFRVQRRDGQWRVLEAIGKSCLDIPAVQGIIVNTRDITERRAIEERIQHLAFHDALTGLPNRSLIQDRISQTVARSERVGKRFAVMFIDIDNFKNINDTLGHDTGDELLRGIANRLTDSVREHDTIARQGGDEFIVLLSELEGQRGATRVAQKILDALRTPFELGGALQHVSGSIGISLYPDDGTDALTLLKNADTAMFHGKALGKNTYQFFTPQMNIAVKRRAAMESNLRAAVQRGDFSLVYQPQVDLNTGEIVALEALVRWVSEENGTMMPGEFIPLAEETGLINELGRWVLRESCRQCKAWLDMGFPPRRMAVNLSARQLADKGFIEMVEAILKETQLDPNLLELEITESQVMRQGEGSVQLLNDLANMGIHLAIDDFGTGYSSLSYLKRLPIGTLKIDQSFIRDITVDPNDTAIVVAIINMSKSLDLEVVAEGIETAGQLTLLRAKGCAVGQGYYFSVPLSAKELEPLLSRQSIFEQPRLNSLGASIAPLA